MSDYHKTYFEMAATCARESTCSRALCGAVIVKEGKILGRGYNAPPLNQKDNSTCEFIYANTQQKPKSDRTCCVHAEWRAIIEALKSTNNLEGSSLYFTRVDKNGDIVFSGEPYCTVCSRLALDVGIKNFILWHKSGIQVYETDVYNRLSYDFHEKTFH